MYSWPLMLMIWYFMNRIHSHHIPSNSLNTFHNCRLLFLFHLQVSRNNQLTRMHSSRMHTARLLTISRCAGGCLPRRCVCIPAFLWADTPLGRHPQPLQADPTRQTPPLGRRPHGQIPAPPWTEFLTCACENITFPQLLNY